MAFPDGPVVSYAEESYSVSADYDDSRAWFQSSVSPPAPAPVWHVDATIDPALLLTQHQDLEKLFERRRTHPSFLRCWHAFSTPIRVFDVGAAGPVSSHVYEGEQPRVGANEVSLISTPSNPLKTISRARFLCTWKDCQYRGCNSNETKNHASTHRQCPKDDCGWADAKNQSQKDRHVWSYHKVWAEKSGYPSQGVMCDECHQTFSRKDRLPRHKREVHAAQKRVR